MDWFGLGWTATWRPPLPPENGDRIIHSKETSYSLGTDKAITQSFYDIQSETAYEIPND